jgi:hypothetical protein
VDQVLFRLLLTDKRECELVWSLHPALSERVDVDPREENATPNELPLAAAPARHDEEPFPPNQNVAVQTGSAIVQTPWSPSRRSPIDFLRLWGRSFAADARSTSHQFRRAMHIRWWQPLVRDLRRELDQLRIRASRISAIPPWLSQHFETDQTEARKRAASSRANRRRTMLSLRRWLHEPLTNQRKGSRGNQRRSID